ncbi:Type 1 glutamine amidotransferase-like domain-containing protein [Pelagicoccus sp. NFK12]|uniref:Type 1 glutamine amidotransferase-like domain-containing protein n=1 Tax=Pelagicoccus enzymogenes TaxID=2773457 RepID=A0A927F672_9BACT|nr:peptidase E [Pelagicoccus enzymogenes]MBD5777905.1 Type 1 glutamine amidotransferase-like domain-containing protein [Pelagicoccus enzymogenes]
MPQKQIIAMGGGGFSMEPDNPLLDAYIVASSPKPLPTVGLLPTASGDSDWLISRFYRAFNQLPCRPKHLPLFRQPVDLQAEVAACDILYVTGGNTRNLLAIWKASGMDKLVRDAWERGVVLAGLSAGAICWFEEGHTDSTGALTAIDCLGFLHGSCSPHYDGEAERQGSYHQLLKSGSIHDGLALDDGAAAHFLGSKLDRVVTSRPQARAFHVSLIGQDIQEKPLATHYLGDASHSLS